MHGSIVLGDDDESRGILIESVYDAWTLDSIDDGWIEFWVFVSDTEILEVIEECIHECSLSPLFPWCWMRIDSCIFVDDSEVIILKYDIQGHIFSDEFHLFYRPVYLDDITTIDFFVLGKSLPIA